MKTTTPDLTKIKLILTDVDGVMTDGRLCRLPGGEEIKFFSIYDGLGVRLAQQAGLEVGIISGRASALVSQRAAELDIRILIQGASDKRTALERVLADEHLRAEQVAYLGDDLPDIPVLTRVGYAVAPCTAVEAVRAVVHQVTRAGGGDGVLREAIETILKAQDKWAGVLARYQSEDR